MSTAIVAALLGGVHSGSRNYRGPTEVVANPEQAELDTGGTSRPAGPRVRVSLGLALEALGSSTERKLLAALDSSMSKSTDPPVEIHRVRPGAGTPAEVCRRSRDELTVMVGYVPQSDDPVVLAHDCRLDLALGIRRQQAASEPGLARALMDEHDALVRSGVKERRKVLLGRKAKIGIVAGVALVAIGIAVGVIVAGALRDETVVLTVGP